ncbi:MAG: hypothetical protein GF405_04070 [Candidatus Eisenbacteria bacterium]|nr:hypothetical protein [Candidatus Eisenbacteria bacterium]
MARKRRKKRSPASKLYTTGILVLMAAVVFVGLTLAGLFEPEPTKAGPQTVLVLNGCGLSGVGERTARLLRGMGYDVVDYRNAESFDYDETFVVDRTGDFDSAVGLARNLDVVQVIQQVPRTPLVDLVVVVGKDCDRFLERG